MSKFSTIPNLALRLGVRVAFLLTALALVVFNYSEFSPSVGEQTLNNRGGDQENAFSTIPNLALRLGEGGILITDCEEI